MNFTHDTDNQSDLFFVLSYTLATIPIPLNLTHGCHTMDVIPWIPYHGRAGIPVAAVIGGGYDKDEYKLAARQSLLHRASIEVWNGR